MLGCPDDTVPGIYVWPWRLEEKSELRNLPHAAKPGHAGPPAAPAGVVHFLVLVRPALTIDGLALLGAARQAMHDHPVLEAGEDRFRITVTSLDVQTLSALFTAAAMPLTICLSAVID